MVVVMYAGFVICTLFLWVFDRQRSTENFQFAATLIAWLIFVYEIFRHHDPSLLALPSAYRKCQLQIENSIIFVYGWEVIRYVSRKIVGKLHHAQDS